MLTSGAALPQVGVPGLERTGIVMEVAITIAAGVVLIALVAILRNR